MQEFDAIVNNQPARNPAKVASWESANRVERAPQQEEKTVPPAGSTNLAHNDSLHID